VEIGSLCEMGIDVRPMSEKGQNMFDQAAVVVELLGFVLAVTKIGNGMKNPCYDFPILIGNDSKVEWRK